MTKPTYEQLKIWAAQPACSCELDEKQFAKCCALKYGLAATLKENTEAFLIHAIARSNNGQRFKDLPVNKQKQILDGSK